MTAPGRRKWLVNALRTGRLANRSILFANIIGFAEEKGYRVINVAFQRYAGLFEATQDSLLCGYPPVQVSPRLARSRRTLYRFIRWTRLLYHLVFRMTRLVNRFRFLRRWVYAIESPVGHQAFQLNSSTFLNQIEASRVILLRGWEFRDQHGVTRHADKIRRYFIPVEKHRKAIDVVIDRARAGCELLIGVHIRQGDYQRYLNGRYFYTVAQYADIMRRLRSLSPRAPVGFLVCSDARLGEAHFPDLPVVVGTGVPVEDLYALARCDLIAGPPSTFTQWASFYGRVPRWEICSLDRTPDLKDFAVASLDLVV